MSALVRKMLRGGGWTLCPWEDVQTSKACCSLCSLASCLAERVTIGLAWLLAALPCEEALLPAAGLCMTAGIAQLLWRLTQCTCL